MEINLKFNFLSRGQLESLNLDSIFLPLFNLNYHAKNADLLIN